MAKPILNYARPGDSPKRGSPKGGVSRSLLMLNFLSLVTGAGLFWLWGKPHGEGSLIQFPIVLALLAGQFVVSMLPPFFELGRSIAPWWEWLILFSLALGGMGCLAYMLVG